MLERSEYVLEYFGALGAGLQLTSRQRDSRRLFEGSPSRANELLKYGIDVLRGRLVIARPEGRIQIALIVLEDLHEMGAWWQHRILEFWIHRAQGGEFIA